MDVNCIKGGNSESLITVDEGNDKQTIYETTTLQSIKKIENYSTGVKYNISSQKHISYYISLSRLKLLKKYEIASLTCSISLPIISKVDQRHYLHFFKEIMLTYKPKKTIKKIYSTQEIQDILPRMFHYYQNYIKYYCNPFFLEFKLGKIIKSFKEQKARLYYNKRYADKTNAKKAENNKEIDKEKGKENGKEKENEKDKNGNKVEIQNNKSGNISSDKDEYSNKINFFNTLINNKINEKNSSSNSNNTEIMFDSGLGIEFVDGTEDNKLNNIKDDKIYFEEINSISKKSNNTTILSKSLKDNCKNLIFAIEGKKYEKDSSKSKEGEKSDDLENSIEEEKIERDTGRHLTVSYNLTTLENTNRKELKDNITTLDSDYNNHVYKTISLTGESQKSNKLKNKNEKLKSQKTISKYSQPIIKTSRKNLNKVWHKNKSSSIDKNLENKRDNILKRISQLKLKENKVKNNSFNLLSQRRNSKVIPNEAIFATRLSGDRLGLIERNSLNNLANDTINIENAINNANIPGSTNVVNNTNTAIFTNTNTNINNNTNELNMNKKPPLIFNKVLYQKQPFKKANLIKKQSQNSKDMKPLPKSQNYQIEEINDINQSFEEKVVVNDDKDNDKNKRPKSNSLSKIIENKKEFSTNFGIINKTNMKITNNINNFISSISSFNNIALDDKDLDKIKDQTKNLIEKSNDKPSLIGKKKPQPQKIFTAFNSGILLQL